MLEDSEDVSESNDFLKKQELWSRLSKRNSVPVDIAGLHRLATFIERPTFRNVSKENATVQWTKQTIPNPSSVPTLPPIHSAAVQNFLTRSLSFIPNKSVLPAPEEDLPTQRVKAALSQLPNGGDPLDPPTANDLRIIALRNILYVWSHEWRTTPLMFSDVNGVTPFGLTTNRSGARDLLICVQSFLIKHLLFERNIPDSMRASYLRPSDSYRSTCLLHAMVDILWRAKFRAENAMVICLASSEALIASSPNYRPDGITEKIVCYKFFSRQECLTFLQKNSQHFQAFNKPGCILFLYSVVLTRTMECLSRDLINMENAGLINDSDHLTQSGINLLLTGRAVSHLHNGVEYFDEMGNARSEPLLGIAERGEVGFLHWDRRLLDPPGSSYDWHFEPVGSMLKTPKLPIWVTQVNGQMGLLFSINAELVSHWRAENKFSLIYYNGLPTRTPMCRLTVDTRRQKTARYRSKLLQEEERRKTPGLVHCIHTKWYGAVIDWNGQMPFI